PKDSLLATTLNNIGFGAWRLGRMPEAESDLRRALAITEQAGKADGEQTDAILANLAEVLDEQRKFDEAEPLYFRIMRLREQRVGQEHAEVASVMGALGAHFVARGEYGKGEDWLRRSLAAME